MNIRVLQLVRIAVVKQTSIAVQMGHYSGMITHLKKVSTTTFEPPVVEYGWEDQGDESRCLELEDQSIIAKEILEAIGML